MPEVAVTEDCDSKSPDDDIRLPGQFRCVKTISDTGCPKSTAQQKLWTSIDTAIPRPDPARSRVSGHKAVIAGSGAVCIASHAAPTTKPFAASWGLPGLR